MVTRKLHVYRLAITYDLRPRAHNYFTLPDKHCALDNCNFITRMLYAIVIDSESDS